MPHTAPAPAYTVILFYKFLRVEDPAAFCKAQRELAQSFGLRGRILVATEGINATLEGTIDAIQNYLAALRSSWLVPIKSEATVEDGIGD